MNVHIFFYLADIVILFVGIPQGQSTLFLKLWGQSTLFPSKKEPGLLPGSFLGSLNCLSYAEVICQIAHTYQKNEQYRPRQGKRLTVLQ
jgi:hypothetical protein